LLCIANPLPDRIRQHRPAPAEGPAGSAPIGDPHLDEPLRLDDRQLAESHRVDQLKDRRVGADAQRQRENRDRRERRVQPQQAGTVLEVLDDGFDEPECVHTIDVLADERRVPELPECHSPRIRRREAAGDVVVGFDLDVGPELAAPFIVPEPPPQKSDPAHRSTRRAVARAGESG
jgi:hypothetical protein